MIQDRNTIRKAHDDFHVVLDEQDGGALVTDLAHEVAQAILLGGIHPGRGLVKKQQLGSCRESSGYLEAALVAVGEVLRQFVGELPDPTELEQLHRFDFAFAFLAPVARAPEESRKDAALVPSVQSDENVLERSHVRE